MYLESSRQPSGLYENNLDTTGFGNLFAASNYWVCNLMLKKKVGRQTGFEPATPGTTSRCSNQLSYYRHKLCLPI